jgi:hypothetical protein
VATPYLAEWAANGVPDADAKMVYSEDSELGRTVIYQWTQSALPAHRSSAAPPSNR